MNKWGPINDLSSGSFPTELWKWGKTEQINKETSAQTFCNKDKMVADRYLLKYLREALERLVQRSVFLFKTSGFQETLLEKRTQVWRTSFYIQGFFFFSWRQRMTQQTETLCLRDAANWPWLPVRSEGEEDCTADLAVTSSKLCSFGCSKQSLFWWDEKKRHWFEL